MGTKSLQGPFGWVWGGHVRFWGGGVVEKIMVWGVI